MNHHDDEQDFRELPEGAAAPFPSEDEWLDLPLPAELSPAPSGGDSFAERVLAARREERQLDRALADLDEVLPAAALQAFRVPEPSPGFVDETVRQVIAERQNRWQRILSRHVAPEPSPEFVARTLRALREDAGTGPQRAIAGRAATPHRQQAPSRAASYAFYGLLAAAAALLLWVGLAGEPRPTLEERLVDGVSLAAARAEATTPLAAIAARIADDEEPDALFDEPIDGLWLLTDGQRAEEVR